MTTKNAVNADLLAGAGQKPRLWYALKRLLGLNRDIDFDKINREVAAEAMRKYDSPEYRALRESSFMPEAPPHPQGAEKSANRE